MAWGTTYIVTTQFLPPNRPFFVSVMRALPIGLLLLARSCQLPRGIWYWRVFVLGVLNFGLFFALLFTAAYRLPGGVIATTNAIQPFVVATLASTFLGEQLTMRLVAAAFAGVVGVGLIVLSPAAPLDLIGVTAALAATISWACGTVLTKRWGKPAPLFVYTAWQLVAAGLVLLPLALILEGRPPPVSLKNAAGFAYLGVVGTALAYAIWFRGIERLKVSTVIFLTLLSPVSAITVDFLGLNRRMSLIQIGGVVFVLVSIVVAQRTNERKQRDSACET
jgi:probable blue pigment (indigoidine) exporter